MNNTFWLVLGMALGVTIAIIFYQQELGRVERQRDRYERLCRELAADYKAQSDELEQAYDDE